MEGVENSFVMNSAPNNKPLSATEEVHEGEVSVQDWDLACATIKFGINRAFGYIFLCPLIFHGTRNTTLSLNFSFFFFFKLQEGLICLKLHCLLRDGPRVCRPSFSRSNK